MKINEEHRHATRIENRSAGVTRAHFRAFHTKPHSHTRKPLRRGVIGAWNNNSMKITYDIAVSRFTEKKTEIFRRIMCVLARTRAFKPIKVKVCVTHKTGGNVRHLGAVFACSPHQNHYHCFDDVLRESVTASG